MCRNGEIWPWLRDTEPRLAARLPVLWIRAMRGFRPKVTWSPFDVTMPAEFAKKSTAIAWECSDASHSRMSVGTGTDQEWVPLELVVPGSVTAGDAPPPRRPLMP